MKLNWIYIIYMLVYSSFTFSQTLSIEDMHKDVEYYFSTIKNKNIDLFSKYSLSQFDSIQQDVLTKINTELSIKDFNRILLTLNQFTDGHTCVGRDNLGWMNYAVNDFLPVSIRNDSAFIGSKIIQYINGQDISKLISEIRKTCSWEFNSKTTEEYIKVLIPFYLCVFYKVFPPYNIEGVDVITNEIYSDSLRLERTKTFSLPYGIESFQKDSIGVLYYTSCQLQSMEDDFEKKLSIIFEEIERQNLKYLFINILQNGGGSEKYNDYIFKYLLSDGYKGSYCMKYSEVQIAQLKSDLEMCNPLKRKFIKLKYSSSIDTVLKTGFYHGKVKIKKNRKGFKGKVFLLQGPSTFSAAVDFSTNFKLRKMGLSVGEECAEPVDYAGNSRIFILPHSKIEFKCATTKLWYSSGLKTINGFLQPDIMYDLRGRKVLSLEDYRKIIELSRKY